MGIKKKTLFYTLALVAVLIGIERCYSYQNGGFRTAKLLSKQPPLYAAPPENVDPLLEQSFRFLGSGGTSFVFLGEDGKTVLKLFKHQHLTFDTFLFRIVLPGISDAWRLRSILQKEKRNLHKRQDFLFKSCNLAYTALKEETGLIYLCLQPNPHFNRVIKLIDTWGISHSFNLGMTEFALQKKVDLFFPHLTALKPEKRKEAIDAVLAQINARCQKGIGDRDPNLAINFGFIEGKAVELDIGSYYLNPALKNPLNTRKELFLCTLQLQKWLEKHSPDLLDYVLERIIYENGR
ncbi:MAG: hypothetical protein HYX67_14640 [Candidatus Melainabacteria bacterium]|nr:hypothetical protein [Candidatus Melainabacteria bacterium]